MIEASHVLLSPQVRMVTASRSGAETEGNNPLLMLLATLVKLLMGKKAETYG